MKKIILITMLILMSTCVLAQTEDTFEGTQPDSPFYFMDRAWDNIRMNNPLIGAEKREQIRIEVYSEREQEAMNMYLIGKGDKAELALNCINSEQVRTMVMSRIQTRLQDKTYCANSNCAEAIKLIAQTQAGK